MSRFAKQTADSMKAMNVMLFEVPAQRSAAQDAHLPAQHGVPSHRLAPHRWRSPLATVLTVRYCTPCTTVQPSAPPPTGQRVPRGSRTQADCACGACAAAGAPRAVSGRRERDAGARMRATEKRVPTVVMGAFERFLKHGDCTRRTSVYGCTRLAVVCAALDCGEHIPARRKHPVYSRRVGVYTSCLAAGWCASGVFTRAPSSSQFLHLSEGVVCVYTCVATSFPRFS